MAVMAPWSVTINDRFTYKVEAINSAEASSEAVRTWRKDEDIAYDLRMQTVDEIHTRKL